MIKRLVLFTIVIMFLLCPQTKAEQSVSKVKDSIVKHSLELGVDPALALSIAKSESEFRHEAKSSHGAIGVFQLMPSTAKRLGVNPYYLSENIKGGLMYYQKMYKMFGSMELALAAYNAGPGTVRRYNKKIPPIRETRRFVSKIMTEYNRQKANPDPAIIKGIKPSVKPQEKSKVGENQIQNSQVTPVAALKPIIPLKPATPVTSVTPAVAPVITPDTTVEEEIKLSTEGLI